MNYLSTRGGMPPARFTEFKTRRDPRCRLCGDSPEIKTVEDLSWSCHFDPTAPRERATVGA